MYGCIHDAFNHLGFILHYRSSVSELERSVQATTSMWKGPVMNICSAAEDEFGAGLWCRDCRSALNRGRRTRSNVSSCPSPHKSTSRPVRSHANEQRLRFNLHDVDSEKLTSPSIDAPSPVYEPAQLASAGGRFFTDTTRPNCANEYEPFQRFEALSMDSTAPKGLSFFRAGLTAVLDAILEAIPDKGVTIVNFG